MRRLLRTPVRPRKAAPLLVAGLLLVALGCGDDRAGEPDQPDPGSPAASSPTSTDDGQWRLVEIVSESAVGGRVSERPAPIGTPAQLRAFTRQFTRPSMRRAVRQARSGHDVSAGNTLVAAVVWVGCAEATGVSYEGGAVTAHPEPKETVECLVPVTSVAVLEVGGGVTGAG